MSRHVIPFPDGIGRVLERADLEDYDAWPIGLASQCKDHRFYEIVEETLDSKFEHHYLLLEDNQGKIRAIQPLFFVQQNLVEGIPQLRGLVDAIRRLFP